MIENNQIEIQLSKSKLVKLLIFSILFLSVGLWMIFTNPETSNPLFNNPIVKAIAFYGSVIMGLIGMYYFSKKLLDKKPALIIDDKGIYDNYTLFNFDLIPWSDVSQIWEGSVATSVASKQQFITVGLVDPDKYISKEKNLIKRKLLIVNTKSYGSPIHLSTNGFVMDHNELLHLLKEEHLKHQSQKIYEYNLTANLNNNY